MAMTLNKFKIIWRCKEKRKDFLQEACIAQIESQGWVTTNSLIIMKGSAQASHIYKCKVGLKYCNLRLIWWHSALKRKQKQGKCICCKAKEV